MRVDWPRESPLQIDSYGGGLAVTKSIARTKKPFHTLFYRDFGGIFSGFSFLAVSAYWHLSC